MITASAPTREQLDGVARELAPDVVRIRCQERLDWTGDPALYFRVILSDEASQLDRLREVSVRVRARLFEEFGLLESDRIPYVKFRSESEQAKIREASWE